MFPSSMTCNKQLSPKWVFLIVSFILGNLGDGLNIFQGIYLVGIGWNEGAVGIALSLMGLTALVIQPWAGDWVDKTTVDRRLFLAVASIMTAISASSILVVREGNRDHMLIYTSKIIEGVASSFIQPCLAALTLATFGPKHFDAVMALNILWGHVGTVFASVLAGAAAYVLYPDIKSCFMVISASALMACFFVQFLPQGDPLMGRGFQGKGATIDENGNVVEALTAEETAVAVAKPEKSSSPKAATYWEVFSDTKTCILCCTGFFFHFANANVLLVLGEMMGQSGGSQQSRSAIPLTAGAIVTAQVIMSVATWIGDKATIAGIGRKPLFMAGLLSLPTRCALILLFKDWGDAWLLSTQIFDGLGGGFFGLIHPFLVADISYGTGRFNVLMGVTTSAFGLGATLSNYIGQMVVQHFDHTASLIGSLVLSFIPVIIFSFMPETYGKRGAETPRANASKSVSADYGTMA